MIQEKLLEQVEILKLRNSGKISSTEIVFQIGDLLVVYDPVSGKRRNLNETITETRKLLRDWLNQK